MESRRAIKFIDKIIKIDFFAMMLFLLWKIKEKRRKGKTDNENFGFHYIYGVCSKSLISFE